ncbi:MAG: FHA domain-containing protein [Hyphomicrobium sp.]|nr:FHA domain-containing protein [Hyphomicrobium sp.]
MSEERQGTTEVTMSQQGVKSGRFLGSLKDALAAASRDDTHRGAAPAPIEPTTQLTAKAEVTKTAVAEPVKSEAVPAVAASGTGLSAAEAAREVKGQTSLKPQDKHVEFGTPPTTRVVRGGPPKVETDAPRTQLVRGKVQVKRGEFEQDPVVGWLVIVGGAGMGCFRAIFEGNNTVGRAKTQRIPLDFGDDTISSEEQAYIRYDSAARSFLFVPNLAKTNVVSINDKRPTGAVELHQMDVITIGRTQLVFVPFCGAEFDWAELTDAKD